MFEESVSSIPSIWASLNSWFTPTVLFVLLNVMIGTIAITSSLGTSQKHHHDSGEHTQTHHQPQLARSPSMLQRLKSINFYSYRSQEPSTHFHKSHEINTNFAFTQEQDQAQQQQQEPHLARSPSILQRLKSINLYHYISQEYLGPPSQAQPTTTAQIQTPEPEPEPEPEPTHFEEEEEEERRDQFEKDGAHHHQSQSLDEIYSQLSGGHVTRSKSDTKPTSGEAPARLSRKMKKSASAKSAFAHFEEADIVESRRPATMREGKAKVTEADDEVDARADNFINNFKQQLKLQRLDSFSRYKEMIERGSEK